MPGRLFMAKGSAKVIALVAAFAMIYLDVRPYLKVLSTADLNDFHSRAIDNNRVTISLNYIDIGFVRRGLGGTIAHILSTDWIMSSLLFNLVSLLWLVAPLALLIARLGSKLSSAAVLYLAVIVVLSPQTFLGWSPDLARTDMLVSGFIAWAVLATMSHWRGVGLVMLLVGFLAHETAVIFGAPLLLVLNAEAYASGELDRGSATRLAAVFLGGLGMIALSQALLSPPGPTIAAYMLRATPLGDYESGQSRDVAIYFMVSGIRGVKAAICYNLDYNRQSYLSALFCVMTLAFYVVILGLQKHIRAVFIAVFVPVIFMLLIATDTGRWVKLGVINSWLLVVFYQLYGPNEKELSFKAMLTGGLLFAGIFAMGPASIFYANTATQVLTEKLGVPFDPDPAWIALDKCDPAWRTLLWH